jgi:uncharacterized protein (DUF983 family)
MKTLSERMDLRRRQILAGLIAGFAAAQTAMILDRIAAPSVWVHVVLIVISLIGWFIFGLELLRMFRMGNFLRKEPDVELALNDEFVRQKRGKAIAAAFWTMMIVQAAIILLNLVIAFDAGIAAQATLTAGVAAVIVGFLYYDRENGDA